MALSLEKITRRVRASVATLLVRGIPEIDQDIGKDLDDLDRQELYMLLENDFVIEIHDPELEENTLTVNSIAQYIYKQLKP